MFPKLKLCKDLFSPFKIESTHEALSHRDIIQALNNIDPRLTKQQRQGQEHMQHQPSAVSRNPSRTSYMASQSALPHHPTVPPEPDRKYAGDPEKGNWSHRSGQGEQYHQQQGQKYHQEKQEQKDLHDQGKQYHQQGQGSQKQKQEQRDQQPKQCQQEKAQHQGQQDQQKQQGLKDLERQGQKDQQLNQSQKDQLKHGQQEQQQDQQSKRRQKDQNRQQGYVPVSLDSNYKGFGFLIWLFFLLPMVSAQCSTCVGGRCYDTGQCILGCVPGYMNRYCNETCPSNCLNKACPVNTTSATITCIDGCKAGYCGTKCTRQCPEGCVTCDRQCGSCNRTLCSERHYGEGCRSVCSQIYEKCDRETGKCIKCKRGYYGDDCDRKCETCYSRGWNLLYKCFSGCEACKEQGACPEGLFGEHCELKCPAKCGLSSETVGHPCNRATGECFAGCVSGYHGLKCNYTCNGFCEGGLCNQHDGGCTSGCLSGYKQKSQTCEKLQDTGDREVTVSQLTLIICLFISNLFIIVLSLVGARVFRRSAGSQVIVKMIW